MVKILMIAMGGGVGALLRYLISGWGQTLVDGWFPLGTPIVIEIVDSRPKIEEFLPHIDEMVQEGLVTLERVEVIKYRASN